MLNNVIIATARLATPPNADEDLVQPREKSTQEQPQHGQNRGERASKSCFRMGTSNIWDRSSLSKSRNRRNSSTWATCYRPPTKLTITHYPPKDRLRLFDAHCDTNHLVHSGIVVNDANPGLRKMTSTLTTPTPARPLSPIKSKTLPNLRKRSSLGSMTYERTRHSTTWHRLLGAHSKNGVLETNWYNRETPELQMPILPQEVGTLNSSPQMREACVVFTCVDIRTSVIRQSFTHVSYIMFTYRHIQSVSLVWTFFNALLGLLDEDFGSKKSLVGLSGKGPSTENVGKSDGIGKNASEKWQFSFFLGPLLTISCQNRSRCFDLFPLFLLIFCFFAVLLHYFHFFSLFFPSPATRAQTTHSTQHTTHHTHTPHTTHFTTHNTQQQHTTHNQPTNQPTTDRPTDRPTDQPTNRPTNQPTNQPTNNNHQQPTTTNNNTIIHSRLDPD